MQLTTAFLRISEYEKAFLLKRMAKLNYVMKTLSIVLVLLVAPCSMANFNFSNSFEAPVMMDDENEIKKKWDDAKGTFQFEVLNRRPDRSLLQIDMSIIEEIISNRHSTEIVYIDYNEYTRIKILPTNQIEGDFQKLELITYVDSFE